MSVRFTALVEVAPFLKATVDLMTASALLPKPFGAVPAAILTPLVEFTTLVVLSIALVLMRDTWLEALGIPFVLEPLALSPPRSMPLSGVSPFVLFSSKTLSHLNPYADVTFPLQHFQMVARPEYFRFKLAAASVTLACV